MKSLDLDIPVFSMPYGGKKQAIIKHWLNGKDIKKIAKTVNTNEPHVAAVINEIKNK